MSGISKNSKRIAYFESIRGLAAMPIVLYHLGADTVLINNVFVYNAWMMLDFFFILSGAVITMAFLDQCQTRIGAADFLWGRFLRVYPLHVLMLMVFVGLECVKWAGINLAGMEAERAAFSDNNLNSFIHNILLTNILILDEMTWNIPSWSVAAEFWVYFIFAGLALFLRNHRPVFMMACGLIALSAFVFLSQTDMTSYHGFARCLWGFFLGVLLMRFLVWSKFRMPIWMMNLVFTICAAVLLTGPWPYDQTYSVYFTAVFFFLLLALFASPDEGAIKRVLSNRWLVRLGTISFGVYMIHAAVWWILAQATRLVVKAWPGLLDPRYGDVLESPTIGLVLIVVGVPIIILLADLSYRLFEKPIYAKRWHRPRFIKALATEAASRGIDRNPKGSPAE